MVTNCLFHPPQPIAPRGLWKIRVLLSLLHQLVWKCSSVPIYCLIHSLVLWQRDGKKNTGHHFHPLVCSLICYKEAPGRTAMSCIIFPNNLSVYFEIWFILKFSQCYYVIFSNTWHAKQFYSCPFKDRLSF